MNKSFVATLTALAEKRNYRQRDLVARTGVDQGAISKILAGHRRIAPEVAARIIAGFRDPAERRDLIRSYLVDTVAAMGLRPEEAPLPRKHPAAENLADLVDAPLYQMVRDLALAAHERLNVRDLIAEIVRSLGLSTPPEPDAQRRLEKKNELRDRLRPPTDRAARIR